jgi:hypothetical protein
MRVFKSFLIVLIAVAVTGCATTTTMDFSQYHETKPRSILILPVVNDSLDVEAPTFVLATLPRVLAEKGYYAFPVNTVKTLLEFEGLYTPAEIHARPTSELAELFGAESVLYVVIHSWTSKYLLFTTTTEVDFEYTIRDKNGEQLWSARKKMAYTPQNNNNSGGAFALVAMAVSAAVEKAKPSYLPLTRQANNNVFYIDNTRIPPGPYSPIYDDYYVKLQGE